MLEWAMRPSGGTITIRGTDAEGVVHKVTRVKQVYQSRNGAAPFAHGQSAGQDVKAVLTHG
ncbi:MAG: hypothetical protein Q7J26_01930 [Brevundimonas sp.]|uniref:hypothetical protein n=1 Tax=Brevundimonas sp. TaxID=1871086 RepID=UPI00271EEE0A|nr:hypothetical protein [Brevundimonas sp.]MDO9607257.1 hypothetical protein [Brevundimonas sp.]